MNHKKELKSSDGSYRNHPLASQTSYLHPIVLREEEPHILHWFSNQVLSRHVYMCIDIRRQNCYFSAVDKEVTRDVVTCNAILVTVGKHPRLSVRV